jgi:hypothetical protein
MPELIICYPGRHAEAKESIIGYPERYAEAKVHYWLPRYPWRYAEAKESIIGYPWRYAEAKESIIGYPGRHAEAKGSIIGYPGRHTEAKGSIIGYPGRHAEAAGAAAVTHMVGRSGQLLFALFLIARTFSSHLCTGVLIRCSYKALLWIRIRNRTELARLNPDSGGQKDTQQRKVTVGD